MWKKGQKLKELSNAPFTREKLSQYAKASGDYNPIHLDDKFAAEAGFPSVIVHGMLSMAYLAEHILMNFPVADYKLSEMTTRFRKVTFPGDSLVCHGEVKNVEIDGTIYVSSCATNQRGEVSADAEVTLKPSRQ